MKAYNINWFTEGLLADHSSFCLCSLLIYFEEEPFPSFAKLTLSSIFHLSGVAITVSNDESHVGRLWQQDDDRKQSTDEVILDAAFALLTTRPPHLQQQTLF